MTKIKIRPLKLEDRTAIFGIQEAITQHKAGKDWARMVEGFINNSGETSLVAEMDGKVVGFMLGEIKEHGFGASRSGWIGCSPINSMILLLRILLSNSRNSQISCRVVRWSL